MKIRFDHPATAAINFERGDELTVSKMTPEIERLVTAERLDGSKVARIVDDRSEEVADAAIEPERAVVGRGRRHGARTPPVSE